MEKYDILVCYSVIKVHWDQRGFTVVTPKKIGGSWGCWRRFKGKGHSCHQIGLKRTLLSGLKKKRSLLYGKRQFCPEKDTSILNLSLV